MIDMLGFLLRPFAKAAASEASAAGEPASVQTDSGKIRGTVEEGVIAFKGVPFTQPPVGALRWRAPQPVKPWDGIRNTMAFSPNPMQPRPDAASALMTLVSAGFSEDCLYLNVWRPATTKSKSLPVLVWFHAGGLVRRGASMYPGDALARHGIVFVSFNYRLGRLGFFAHPALAREAPDDLRGNYGYMDQIAALRWVQRNITAFGGDPKNVTVASESAGGGSVLVLLTSSMARGLFQRAILESPNMPGARAVAGPMRELASAESIAVQYAHSLGIEGDDEVALARLRSVPADTLAEGTEDYLLSIFGGPEIPGLSHSIIDGRLVVEAPESVLRAGKQTMIPVIVGANDHDLAASPAQTKDALFARFGPLASQAHKSYDPNGDVTFQDLTQAIVADETIIEPSRCLAELMTKAGQPAYFYRFSYVPEALRAKTHGATHGAEIPFALGAVSAFLKNKASKADLAMARTISGYWVDFVKNGDPNGGGRPAWPRYNPATAEVLNITNTSVACGHDPLKTRLDLWRGVWELSR
jgi:para-nitrobenzyl esterase